MSNKLENDIILRSALPDPHDSIRVPARSSQEMTIKTSRSNSMVFSAIDATNGRRVEINGKPMILLKPTDDKDDQKELYIPAKGKRKHKPALGDLAAQKRLEVVK